MTKRWLRREQIRSRSATVVLVVLIAVGCQDDPADGTDRYIEFSDGSEPPVRFDVPTSRTQAGGPDELLSISGQVQTVTHNLTNRHAAFMLTGDVLRSQAGDVAGSPPSGLLLPTTPSQGADTTVSIQAFDPQKWTSFRVQDRGECSVFIPWKQVTTELVRQIIHQMNESGDIIGASLERAEVTPTLRSALSRNESYPRDFDSLDLELDLWIASIGPCNAATPHLSIELRLSQTNVAFFPVPVVSFWKACVDGEVYEDEKFLSVKGAKEAICHPFVSDPPFSNDCLPTRQDEFAQFVDDLRLGRLPTCSGTRGGVAGVPSWPMLDMRMLSNLVPHDVSRVDDIIFVGLTSVEFDPADALDVSMGTFDAHDLIARVSTVDVSDVGGLDSVGFLPADCALARSTIEQELEEQLADALPDGLRSAILELSTVDPVLATSDMTGPEVSCNAEAPLEDVCDYRNADGPAYAGNTWRGGRHRCWTRDPNRGAASLLESASDLVAALPADDLCHIQLEPRRLNVRPDGVELVLLDGTDDPQADFFEGSLLGETGELCNPERLPWAEVGPEVTGVDVPIVITGQDLQ